MNPMLISIQFFPPTGVSFNEVELNQCDFNAWHRQEIFKHQINAVFYLIFQFQCHFMKGNYINTVVLPHTVVLVYERQCDRIIKFM